MNAESRKHNDEEIKRLESILDKCKDKLCRQCYINTTYEQSIFCIDCLKHQDNAPCSLCGKTVQRRMKKFCPKCKKIHERLRACLFGRIKQRMIYEKMEYLEGLSTKQLIDFVDEKKEEKHIEGGKMKAIINGIEIEGTSGEFADFFGKASEKEAQIFVEENTPIQEIIQQEPQEQVDYVKHGAWTQTEIDKLMEMRDKKMNYTEISSVLGRRKSSCQAQVHNIRHNIKQNKKNVEKPVVEIEKTNEKPVVEIEKTNEKPVVENKTKRESWTDAERIEAVKLLRKGATPNDVAKLMGKKVTTLKMMKYNMEFYDSVKGD